MENWKVVWEEWKLRMNFTTPLCGGVPKNQNLIDVWLETRKPSETQFKKIQEGIGPDNKTPQSMDEVKKQTEQAIEEAPNVDAMCCGFLKDETGLYVRGGSIRAHLKEAADVIGQQMRAGVIKPKISNFRSKFVDRCYVREEKVYILDENGQPMMEATGDRETTLNVLTRQGPRTCLKKIDYCFPCQLEATVQFLPNTEITLEALQACFEYGRVSGFNQDRGLQYGRYDYTLTKPNS